MNHLRLLVTVCLSLILFSTTTAQGLKAFKLQNGLSVFIWEDETVPDVFGMVAVDVGSKEDPENYTGLAHYLEHLLFKGTEKIGTLDWEKEKPVYEQIIAKYDERAKETDPVKREAISKEINQLTIESAKYNLSNEFSNLIQGMGGENLNAGTSFDHTVYYNSFPSGETYKWLELNSERFINPVFRSFQTELETVYEEYNRYQDQQMSRVNEYVQSVIFPEHPYGRPIIGLPEHLKNPQLSQLINFYNTWYVPENMALILVGNVKTTEIFPVISEKFGRLEKKSLPERKKYAETPLKGKKAISAKIAQYPQILLAFPGITASSEDEIALEICASLLTNSSRTGLLDNLVLKGNLMGGGAYLNTLKDRGRIMVSAVPYYDANQRRFESLGTTEKTLLKEIKKLQDGQFEEWLVESIKSEMIRMFDLNMESHYTKANMIADYFLSGKDMSKLIGFKDIVASITTEQIKGIAKKYFGTDYYAISLSEGKPPKTQELEKPGYDPVLPLRGVESEYSKVFKLMPVNYSHATYANMNEVEIKQINDRSKLFYVKNPENDIFTLTLKFGIGTEKMPKLALSAQLMNNAGIMGFMDAQGVKRQFSNLGATCRYRVDDSYLYVIMEGFETNLEASCNLLTRQIILPQLDEKQMNNLIGNQYQMRRIEKTSSEYLADALEEYLLYQDKSDYIDRLSLDDIIALTVSNLTGEFQRATDYEAEIHYVGALPLDKVYDILSKNLPLKANEKPTTSPEIKERVVYAENTILFLPNNDAKQSTIHFYVQGDSYNNKKDSYLNAFNQYFSGGFSGLVTQEIREYRSMAYSSYGYYAAPSIANKPAHFIGSLGTQADKTLDAVEVYMDLLTNMPQYPDRISNIKNFMKGTSFGQKPHFRNASQVYENWKRRGYVKSPAETNMQAIEDMTFDDIVKFYEENIKGRPVTIAIVGNPKMIDEKALSKYGKVIKLSSAKIFSKN